MMHSVDGVGESTREGATQIAPSRGSQSRRLGGTGAPNPTTLVVALVSACATARVEYYTVAFSRQSFGDSRPLRLGAS